MASKRFVLCLVTLFALCACGHKQGASLSSLNNDSTVTSSDSGLSLSSEENLVVSNYNHYYESLVTWDNGEDLKNQLYTIMRKDYYPLSYNKSSVSNYETNINADHTKLDFEYLDVIYSQDDVFKTETNVSWQREHAFCASLMCGSTTSDAVKMKGRATDFHNLFAATTNGNTSRGNKNYGEADISAASYKSRLTSDGKDGYSYDSTNFEPAEKDKGRLARAIFYMATMYKEDEVDTANNINMKGLKVVERPVDYVAGNNCAFAIGNLSTLIRWNKEVKVDYLEMQHNISVYQDVNSFDEVAQGNRNPFIDFPELVDYAFGNKKDQPGRLVDLTPSSSYLGCEENSFSHYAIKEAQREYQPGATFARVDFVVVAVNKDYSYNVATDNISSASIDYTFKDEDGNYYDIDINAGEEHLSYRVNLNPMASCTNYYVLDKATINNTKPDEDQEVKYGDDDFIINYSTTATGAVTLTNDNQNGGFKIGSSTASVTRFSIKTKNSYSINRLYIKCGVANKSSSYKLLFKVAGSTVKIVSSVNDNVNYVRYGIAFDEPIEGDIEFVFNGSNGLRINSIAFNTIIA